MLSMKSYISSEYQFKCFKYRNKIENNVLNHEKT